MFHMTRDVKTRNIYIIILTWNGLELTKRCLNSLMKSKFISDVNILVVDNGSTDGTVEYLKSLESVTLLENDKNLGYAKAVNRGLLYAGESSDIILLNNDTVLTDEYWLQRIICSATSNDKYGIIGTKILKNLSDEIQHCGAYLPMDTFWGQQVAGGELDVGQYQGIYECESVVFACVYIKAEVIKEIGLLEEKFFAYFEDTDFCLRASRAGYKVIMDGDITVHHFENSSTKVNKVSHSDIFLNSQQTFKDLWEPVLKAERYKKGSLDLHSIINFPSGYASSARAFVEGLDKVGVKTAYQYVYGPGTVFPVAEPKHSDSYIVNMIRARKFEAADVQVVYAQGDVFEKNTGKYKVGFTMLETDGLPDEWVRQANLMDEVWVPSEFNKETFKNSGVTVPIHVIPLGVDPAYFSPKIKSNKLRGAYTFLSIFEWGERKCPELLLKAFSDEFSDDEDVVLVCKVNNNDASVNIKNEISALNLRENGGRIVVAENHIMQRYEMGVLYTSADCFVLPTRGEGWGMPILEAMACGLPVIATNWSAQVDFMNKENSLPLKIEKLVPAEAKCPYYKGFSWAEPSYDHLRLLMRWVYENQDKAKDIGNQAAVDALNWTWDNACMKISDRIREIEVKLSV